MAMLSYVLLTRATRGKATVHDFAVNYERPNFKHVQRASASQRWHLREHGDDATVSLSSAKRDQTAGKERVIQPILITLLCGA